LSLASTVHLQIRSTVQLYNKVRGAILAGKLVDGSRLPSTRELAAELGLSRTTVLNAFDQLIAEGYVEGHTGVGTYVTRSLPEDSLQIRAKIRSLMVAFVGQLQDMKR
jgi:DNA-binding GntR family transcriptional regulator